MTDRLTRPIRKRLKITSQQTKENFSDIWSRMAIRLSQIYARFEKVEGHLEKGQSYNVQIEARMTKLGSLFGRSAAANELIVGAIAELVSVISDQSEELSQSQIEMAMILADLQAQKAEMERAKKITIEGKDDTANLQTVAQEGRRFTQDDPDTIGVMLDEVNKGKLIQALTECGEQTWQELLAAFEAAGKARE